MPKEREMQMKLFSKRVYKMLAFLLLLVGSVLYAVTLYGGVLGSLGTFSSRGSAVELGLQFLVSLAIIATIAIFLSSIGVLFEFNDSATRAINVWNVLAGISVIMLATSHINILFTGMGATAFVFTFIGSSFGSIAMKLK